MSAGNAHAVTAEELACDREEAIHRFDIESSAHSSLIDENLPAYIREGLEAGHLFKITMGSTSMEPLILAGDTMFVDVSRREFQDLKRDEVVFAVVRIAGRGEAACCGFVTTNGSRVEGMRLTDGMSAADVELDAIVGVVVHVAPRKARSHAGPTEEEDGMYLEALAALGRKPSLWRNTARLTATSDLLEIADSEGMIIEDRLLVPAEGHFRAILKRDMPSVGFAAGDMLVLKPSMRPGYNDLVVVSRYTGDIGRRETAIGRVCQLADGWYVTNDLGMGPLFNWRIDGQTIFHAKVAQRTAVGESAFKFLSPAKVIGDKPNFATAPGAPAVGEWGIYTSSTGGVHQWGQYSKDLDKRIVLREIRMDGSLYEYRTYKSRVQWRARIIDDDPEAVALQWVRDQQEDARRRQSESNERWRIEHGFLTEEEARDLMARQVGLCHDRVFIFNVDLPQFAVEKGQHAPTIETAVSDLHQGDAVVYWRRSYDHLKRSKDQRPSQRISVGIVKRVNTRTMHISNQNGMVDHLPVGRIGDNDSQSAEGHILHVIDLRRIAGTPSVSAMEKTVSRVKRRGRKFSVPERFAPGVEA